MTTHAKVKYHHGKELAASLISSRYQKLVKINFTNVGNIKRNNVCDKTGPGVSTRQYGWVVPFNPRRRINYEPYSVECWVRKSCINDLTNLLDSEDVELIIS